MTAAPLSGSGSVVGWLSVVSASAACPLSVGVEMVKVGNQGVFGSLCQDPLWGAVNDVAVGFVHAIVFCGGPVSL